MKSSCGGWGALIVLLAPAVLAQGRHGEPEPPVPGPSDRRFTAENIWARNPDAPRWALDAMAGPTLASGDFSWMVKASARYAVLPWIAFGLSGGYHAAVDPAHVALGTFLELHMVPGGLMDPWLRFTAGNDFVVGRDDSHVPRDKNLFFREIALGIAFGGPTFSLGPYFTTGPTLPTGENSPSLGLRLDLPIPRDD